MVLVVKSPPVKAGDLRDLGLISRSGRYLGERNGNPLQYSCLENPHGQRSPSELTVHGVAQSRT